MSVCLKYVIFAALATVANISAQHLSLSLYVTQPDLVVAVLAGTAVGLLIKYQLDKRFIFRFNPRSLVHDSRTFVLYTGVGVFTTLVFWAFEFGFHRAFETTQTRYLGAVLGLAIGYWLKYQLDKRFVFLREGV